MSDVKRVSVPGAKVAYYLHGNPQGEKLVLQHGYTSCAATWNEPLSRWNLMRFYVLTVDMRGTGNSVVDEPDKESQYSIVTFADDLKAVCDHAGFQHFNLVGHSLGGGIAIDFTHRFPDRVDKLVLECPIPFKWPYPATPEARAAEIKKRDKKASKDPKDVEDILGEMLAGDCRHDRDVNFYRTHLDAYHNSIPGYIRGGVDAIFHADIVDQAKTIKNETLMIVGAADFLLKLNMNDYMNHLQHATIHVFSRCGHSPHYEVAGHFVEVVTDFLNEGVVTVKEVTQRIETFKKRREELRASGDSMDVERLVNETVGPASKKRKR
eukprot:GFYU01002297.1.p1 GENE.GFYU01002297.1~~GFYU01002297.1.p1  ORF type:complete len:323 (-),score=91.70 GFYU01002297.1:130-1098(-)